MSDFTLTQELFLIGHDEFSGKASVNDDLLDTGLAGSTLAELLIAGRIDIKDGLVMVRDSEPWGSRLTDAVLAEIVRRGNGHPVRAWLEHLRGEIRGVVARDLTSAGVIRREEQKSSFGRKVTVRYPAANTLLAASPRVRLGYVVNREPIPDTPTATLAGLVVAVGLDRFVVVGSGKTRERLAAAGETARVPIPALLKGVHATVAAIALQVGRR
jgi:hypothetical protein